MSARTIEASIDAWMTSGEASARSLLASTPVDVVNTLAYSVNDMSSMGWLKFGRATIRVEVEDVEGILGKQIEALREARDKVLADAQMQATEWDRKIQSLLAIEHDTSTARKAADSCWRCKGSGDMEVTAGSGPDTWTETTVCSQCGGTGDDRDAREFRDAIVQATGSDA